MQTYIWINTNKEHENRLCTHHSGGKSHENTVARQLGNIEAKHNLANTKANELAC